MRFLAGALLIAATLVSCSKWNEYQKYTVNGEIIYSGKLDSVKALSGKHRVRIRGRLNADPKISVVKVFWNNKADSLVYKIDRNVLTGNIFEQTFPMPESVTTFAVYTYDTDGNKSVPVYVTGKSFGEAYRRTLTNRLISSLSYKGDSTTINWDAALATVVETEVKYPKNPTLDTAIVVTPGKDPKTVLNGFNFNTAKFIYKTVYRPDSTCIDTFVTRNILR
jgi:hypothetical protein